MDNNLGMVSTCDPVLCVSDGVELIRHFMYKLLALISYQDIWVSMTTHHLKIAIGYKYSHDNIIMNSPSG